MSEGEEVKRRRRRRVFVLISLTVVFVAMVLSGKMSWEALTSSGTLLGLMVIVLYKVGSGLDPVFNPLVDKGVDGTWFP